MQPTTEAKAMKKLRGIQRSVDRHWVGNGFHVQTLIAYPNLGSVLSPFILLDYAAPRAFSPTDERRCPRPSRHTCLGVLSTGCAWRSGSWVGGRE